MGENSNKLAEENASGDASKSQSLEDERKARVDAIWEQMNKGLPAKTPKHFQAKSSSSAVNKSPREDKNSHNWMTLLGLGPNKAGINGEGVKEKRPVIEPNGSSEEAKKLAAAAIAAVKDGAALGSLPARGKVEITEVRDFAGQEIEIKKVVDADSEAAEKAKLSAGPPSAVDAILDQIKKKQKLNVLDKTKKDWGEFKDENKGVENELDAYKKSSNQYLDKVSFLQRTDYREFERERDARLAVHSKRKTDMRED